MNMSEFDERNHLYYLYTNRYKNELYSMTLSTVYTYLMRFSSGSAASHLFGSGRGSVYDTHNRRHAAELALAHPKWFSWFGN